MRVVFKGKYPFSSLAAQDCIQAFEVSLFRISSMRDNGNAPAATMLRLWLIGRMPAGSRTGRKVLAILGPRRDGLLRSSLWKRSGGRSEERRVGEECVSTGRTGWGR